VRDKVTDTVGFHVLEEPLLYPRIDDAVAYASSKGLRTELHTNGSLLTENRVSALMRSGLDSLSISAQTLSRDEHKGRGTAMPFDEYRWRVMEAVRMVRDSRGETEVVLCVMNTATMKVFDVDEEMRVGEQGQAFKERLTSFLLDLCGALDQPVSRQEIESVLDRWVLPRPRVLRVDE
jgi:uncharacterized Fe-S cluster-containing radical SAM superfamily enzyme